MSMRPLTGHGPKLHGQELRDRLLQLVYDNGSSRTGLLREQLGDYVIVDHTCGHDDCTDPKHERRRVHSYWNSDVTPTLRKMARDGEIVRVPQKRSNQGDEWRALDYQPLSETSPPKTDEWDGFAAMMGAPARMTHGEFRDNGYRNKPGKLDSGAVSRARSRAQSRLVDAHPGEFKTYWLEEQWKIARGETQ